MKKYLLCSGLIIGFGQHIFCQDITGTQTSCTAAAQNTVGKFTISYTIGEVTLVQSWQANGLFITQGVMQPLTFIADTAYECFSHTEVRVYPNPNPGIFSLQLSILNPGNAKIILFDASGKQLQQDQFSYTSFITKQYNIARWASGTYYLQLFFTPTGSTDAKKCVYTIQKLN